MPSRPRKKLILAVHGVGQQIPGETVGLLAAALPTFPGTDTTAATHLFLESQEDSSLPGEEGDAGIEQGGAPRLFECRTLRRKTKLTDELFAEVFWADVSANVRTTFQTVLALFQVILGLGHLVRESAEHTYRNSAFLKNLANAGVWLLHGPIAAINALVLITAIMVASIELTGFERIVKSRETMFLWPVIYAVAIIAFSVVMHGKVKRYLIQHFFKWMIIAAAVMAALASVWHRDTVRETPTILWTTIEPVFESKSATGNVPTAPLQRFREVPYTLDAFGTWVRASICSWADESEKTQSATAREGEGTGPPQPRSNQRRDANQGVGQTVRKAAQTDLGDGARDAESACLREISGIHLLNAVLIMVQWISWLVLLFLTNLLFLCHFIRRTQWADRGFRPIPALAPVALSAMMMFWLLILSCIWAVAIFFYPEFGGHKTLFVSAFHPVYVNWFVLAAVAVLAIWLTYGPELAHTRIMPPNRYFHERKRAPRAPPRMIVHDCVAVAVMACPVLLFLVMGGLTVLSQEGSFLDVDWVKSMDRVSREHFDKLFLSALLLGGALYALRDQIATGIGIAGDVINYMRIGIWEDDRRKRHYPQRERIERRFVVVARKLIEQHEPDEIIVVAHSQGTVVALDALMRRKHFFDGQQRQNRRWKLITMGSPFTHLYGHYFPFQFRVPPKEATYLDDWLNIFRIDDFIGTHIDPAGRWPREVPIGPGGHTYYWVEDVVEEILRDEITPETASRFSVISDRLRHTPRRA